MPRQIVDTESSRPRYVRRIALTVAVIVILAGAAIYLAYVAYSAGRSGVPRGGNTPSARVSWQPSITRAPLRPALPKESSCSVA